MTLSGDGAEKRAKVLNWLKQWFERRDSGVPLQTDANYLEAGMVDSLGLMELIAAIEKEFGVQFNEDHFADPRFSTARGLSELIAELSPTS